MGSCSTMTSEVKPKKIPKHENLTYKRNCEEHLKIVGGIKGTWNRIARKKGT